jgi:hypothetical protein
MGVPGPAGQMEGRRDEVYRAQAPTIIGHRHDALAVARGENWTGRSFEVTSFFLSTE